MSRRSKPTAKSWKAASFSAQCCCLPEIEEIGILNPQELAQINNFYRALQQRTPAALATEARTDFEVFMQLTGEDVGIQWRNIPKRSTFQTALYYVFFQQVKLNFEPLFQSVDSFLTRFPEFESQREEDVQDRLDFANAVDLVSKFIPPKQNKQVYMEVASRVATNFKRRFVTGGGQTPETADRVMIYERLCGVVKHKRFRRTKEQMQLDEMQGIFPRAVRNTKVKEKPTATCAPSVPEKQYSADVLAELITRVMDSDRNRLKRSLVPMRPDAQTPNERKRMKVQIKLESSHRNNERRQPPVESVNAADDDDDDDEDYEDNGAGEDDGDSSDGSTTVPEPPMYPHYFTPQLFAAAHQPGFPLSGSMLHPGHPIIPVYAPHASAHLPTAFVPYQLGGQTFFHPTAGDLDDV